MEAMGSTRAKIRAAEATFRRACVLIETQIGGQPVESNSTRPAQPIARQEGSRTRPRSAARDQPRSSGRKGAAPRTRTASTSTNATNPSTLDRQTVAQRRRSRVAEMTAARSGTPPNSAIPSGIAISSSGSTVVVSRTLMEAAGIEPAQDFAPYLAVGEGTRVCPSILSHQVSSIRSHPPPGASAGSTPPISCATGSRPGGRPPEAFGNPGGECPGRA
jgi:hypothetical protein